MITVTTLNVLHKDLSNIAHHHECIELALKSERRLILLENLLLSHIHKNEIICLQEMSLLWIRLLKPLFTTFNYSIRKAVYNMMVVVIVVPSSFKILKWKTKTIEESTFSKIVPEQIATIKKPNKLLVVEIEEIETKRRIVIGTYHMPCLYDKPNIMFMHCLFIMHEIQLYARQNPCILCGDFNLQPDCYIYDFIINKTVSIEINQAVQKFIDKINKMNTTLPDVPFTCQSKASSSPVTFSGILDYIFYTKLIPLTDTIVTGIEDPKNRQVSYPTLNWPSDHMMLTRAFTFEE